MIWCGSSEVHSKAVRYSTVPPSSGLVRTLGWVLLVMLSVESLVRGYHVYMNDWSPSVGDEFAIEVEEHDRYAVAVKVTHDGHDRYAVAIKVSGDIVRPDGF